MPAPRRRRSRFVPAKGLDAAVARAVAAPAVTRFADEVEAEAKRNMPEAKTWLSMRDDKVRKTHVTADGQTIPANLRFKVGKELLRAPRDPNGSLSETAECRCEDPRLPNAVRDAVSAGPTRVAGTRASATVAAVFERIEEVEFGTAEEPPLRPMGNAARTVASRHRSA